MNTPTLKHEFTADKHREVYKAHMHALKEVDDEDPLSLLYIGLTLWQRAR